MSGTRSSARWACSRSNRGRGAATDSAVKTLYKYLHPDRIEDILARRLIRFTQPACLNDPFEMSAPIDASTQKSLNERFGVLSLSEVAGSILMWSHYAASHSGFVLELDAAHPFFDWRRHPHDRLRRAQPMQYEVTPARRARFDEKDWRRSNNDAERDRLEYLAGFFLLTKSMEWAYEREWRMIVPLSSAVEVRPLSSGDAHLFELPPLCIRGVITGSRMRQEARERIAGILEGSDYVHVELRRAEEDRRRFRVFIRDHESVLEKRLLEDVNAFSRDGVQQRMQRLDVSSPRYYEAERALSSAGLISCEPAAPPAQKKKILALTPAGRSLLDARRRAIATLQDAAKSSVDRYMDSLGDGSLDATELMARILEDALENTADAEEMDPKAVEFFAALSDEDEDVRWRAAHSLRMVGDAPTVEHLIAILRWRDNEELVWLQDEDDVDEDEIGRVEADAPAAYFALDNRKAWGKPDFTRVAAYALAGIVSRMAVPEAVDPLIDVLDDPEDDVRWQIIDALGHLGSPRALPQLRRMARTDKGESSWGSVAAAARDAIRRIKARRGRPR